MALFSNGIFFALNIEKLLHYKKSERRISMKFKQRLRYLLAERDMTQKALAEKLYVEPTTMSGYVKGHRQPSFETLIRMAKFFDVSTDYLLGITDFR
jgi:DNA-binding XRE family transcriptional regulator